jgi:hypothetical protein
VNDASMSLSSPRLLGYTASRSSISSQLRKRNSASAGACRGRHPCEAATLFDSQMTVDSRSVRVATPTHPQPLHACAGPPSTVNWALLFSNRASGESSREFSRARTSTDKNFLINRPLIIPLLVA